MKNFIRAEEVFKDFPEERKLEIFKVAAGKLVYFPKNKNKNEKIDIEQVLIDYMRAKNYREIAEESGTNIMRICRIVNAERKRFSKERVNFWRKRGLSLRGIAKLYKKSHEGVRQIVEE